MKKNKLIILIIIVLIFLISQLVITYSKYVNDAYGEAKEKIGQWVIKVNDTDITTTNNVFSIDNIIWEEDPNVKEGKVAPGMCGHFDIVIDPSGTDVSIKYSMTIDVSSLSQQNCGIGITSIIELGGNELIQTGENTYTGIINLDEIKQNTTNTIRVNVEWQDIEENNKQDYILASNYGTNIEIPIEVDVIQYLGENIEEYVKQEN